MVIDMKRLLTVLLLTLASLGFAQNLSDGTELLMTDLTSQTIVGHGKVSSSQVVLNLSEEAGEFNLYVVTPDGEVATHHGAVKPDGFVGVFADDGDLLDFSEVLAGRGITLVVQRVPALEESVTTDDNVLEPPRP
jgi:hypothetical protein